MTPLKAVRLRCLECSETITQVRDCQCSAAEETPPDANGGYYCALYPFRMGHKPKGAPSVLKSIRKYCLWCCDGSSAEVARCEPRTCPLRRYRDGHNPALAGKGGNAKHLLPYQKTSTHGAIPASGTMIASFPSPLTPRPSFVMKME